MSKFIDFQDVKKAVTIEDAITRLGLALKPNGPQMRGPCPVCKSGGDRTLVITPAKQAFYCFAAKNRQGEGGDVIALAAHIKSCTMKEAAEFLTGTTAEIEPTKLAVFEATIPVTVPEKKKAGLNPLNYLQAEHPLVQALGISKETAEHFGAGYAPKGIMRGRLAIPIHDVDGVLVAYCGQALNGESPALIFPKDFVPEEFVFNIYRIKECSIYLMREPFAVLKAFDGGIENAVAFFTANVRPDQLAKLADVMTAHGITTLELN